MASFLACGSIQRSSSDAGTGGSPSDTGGGGGQINVQATGGGGGQINVQATGGGGGHSNVQTGTGGAGGKDNGSAPDAHGVTLGVPSVVVDGKAIRASSLVTWTGAINFTNLQIAVRAPSGGTNFSTAFAKGNRATAGSTTLTGTGTCDVAGVYTAFATYTLVDSPADADWVNGPPVTFTIGGGTATGGTGNTFSGTGGSNGANPGTGGGASSLIKLGFSYAGVADGSLAAWLTHHRVEAAATWNDQKDGQADQGTIQAGKEYGQWDKLLDVAVGGIYTKDGETWAAAADGQFDDRWTAIVAALKRGWGTRDQALLHVRFAHEFNLEMSDWRVRGQDASSFKKAWGRFNAILKKELPKAQLVWCPNDGTSGSLGLDIGDAYPGGELVDVVCIDTYNQYPWVDSAAAFDAKIHKGTATSPVGAARWLEFARAAGKPLAIAEWANNGNPSCEDGPCGDSPDYIQRFYDWLIANGGTGAGQIKYAVYFNGWTQFQLFPTSDSLQPKAAALVQKLF